ncbi:hypothetical protein PRIPAC_91106 [Pristionchus pacificus]|uniref:Uncharacterized protein n=1 Tax=Pristionchus pacificus TaxID=54126 RepID=A0A2A6CYE5_PRIPA|nr:hypothetical protein PRIPAC_91106 [Pristionchus pacificus]|eukprot:PDM83051.1 hypothetical protein PRIPAC_37444 [Pristionchus pacificus]
MQAHYSHDSQIQNACSRSEQVHDASARGTVTVPIRKCCCEGDLCNGKDEGAPKPPGPFKGELRSVTTWKYGFDGSIAQPGEMSCVTAMETSATGKGEAPRPPGVNANASPTALGLSLAAAAAAAVLAARV